MLTALTSDKTLYARHINVRADNGVVTLSGHVWTTEELVAAPQIAEAVPGVTQSGESDRGGSRRHPGFGRHPLGAAGEDARG